MSAGVKIQPTNLVGQTSSGEPDHSVLFTSEKKDLKYPRLSSYLNQLVARMESGKPTAEQAAMDSAIHQNGLVAVTVHLAGKADSVMKFLENEGGEPRNVGEDYIEAYVPITVLGSLSQQPGVLRVREIVPPQPAGPSQPAGAAHP